MAAAAAGSIHTRYGYPTPGPQSPTGQQIMDHLYFCSNDELKRVRQNEHFDYVVVGTGPCGLAFVDKVLSKNPKSRILMLERGGYFLPEHVQNLPSSLCHTYVTGLSETFPWTLSSDTTQGEYIKYQHGMVPFFGGKSTVWSGWCPRPNKEEFFGWPQKVIDAAMKYFEDAEKLLNVVPGESKEVVEGKQHVNDMHPFYDTLQCELSKTIETNLVNVGALTRSMSAPLAVGVTKLEGGINFQKFATPEPLLELQNQSIDNEEKGLGKRMKIVTNCIVERIYQQKNKASALKTSRGVFSLGDAKLILAMGTIPPATLIQNSFQSVPQVGKHLGAHFISKIVGRIKVEHLEYGKKLKGIELGAVYVAGINNGSYKEQFHIQLSAFHDTNPTKNAVFSFQYAPDVMAAASRAQLETSKGYVVFVLACLGEMDVGNASNEIRINKADSDDDQTSNIYLNLTTQETDEQLWDVMDESSFSLLETIISSPKDDNVQYWHGTPDFGEWLHTRPPTSQIRVPGTVHESSTLIIGDESDENTSVGFDYRLHGVDNVYVTGGGLWPRSASWNPTLTMVALAQHLADNLTTSK